MLHQVFPRPAQRHPLLALLTCAVLAGCSGGDDSGPVGGGGGTGIATLSWLPPTENTDGTALTNLAGYRIHGGTNPNSLSSIATIQNPGVTSYVVERLASGTHYFSISAYNSDGYESARSGVGSKTIP